MYIEKLARRTLLLYLRSNPAPASLRESLSIHTALNDFIGNSGSLIQYRQSICPVTKVRLPKLRALIEDNTRGELEPRHLIWSGKSSLGELSELEKRLLDIGETHPHLRVTAMTRDLGTINEIRKAGDEDADVEVENETEDVNAASP